MGLGLPFFLLVVFGIVPSFKGSFYADARFTVFGYYLPVRISLAVGSIALFCVPPLVVSDQENLWLRRISTTPAPPSWLLGAQTAVSAGLACSPLPCSPWPASRSSATRPRPSRPATCWRCCCSSRPCSPSGPW